MNYKFLIPLCIALAACSNNADNKDADGNQSGGYTMTSAGLIRQANEALDAGDYDTAIQYADSVHKAFPADIEGRKTALNLSCKAKERQLTHKLAQADSLLNVAEASGDEIAIKNAKAQRTRIEYMLRIATNQVKRTAPGKAR